MKKKTEWLSVCLYYNIKSCYWTDIDLIDIRDFYKSWEGIYVFCVG